MPPDEFDDLLRAAMLTERLRWRDGASAHPPAADGRDNEPEDADAAAPPADRRGDVPRGTEGSPPDRGA